MQQHESWIDYGLGTQVQTKEVIVHVLLSFALVIDVVANIYVQQET